MLNMEKFTCGVCYYPEHWDEGMWADDLRRMKECGIEVIRIAEFAWNQFEPEEGVYTFSFFDRFMEYVDRAQMKVIFCTPTATPPVWLSEKYPEILNADIDGNLYYHGTRRHYNLNSKVYREFCRKITEKLAEHYCSHPAVIGWQLDNEINCEMDLYYSESDHQAFREYLQEKYGTLENLNDKMGTVFWNQSYTDWQQVHLARRTNTLGQTNPHMQLEEKRFISESVVGFFKLQADTVRKYLREGQFITTNGLFRHIDYHRLVGEVLDFITFDNYPAFAFEPFIVPEETNGLRDRNSSYQLTRTRSISRHFGIMEQQTGAGGWNCRMLQPMPKPGQIRLWTMQAAAHGADFISYFRWRTCTFGTEIYWHGINDYSNVENRRVREVKRAIEDLGKIGEITKADFYAEVSILMDYDNDWDGENDIWHGDADRMSKDGWFCALQKRHIPFDFTYINDKTEVGELRPYKYLIYPHATIFTKERAEVLKEYIAGGGVVVFGCRTGYKDITGKCYQMEMPGYAAELCGCVVEDYTPLSQFDGREFIVWQDAGQGKAKASAPMFNDVLRAKEGEAAAFFENNYYDGKPAVVRKKTGDGWGYYVGSVFAEDTAGLLIDKLGIRMPYQLEEVFEIPEEVEFTLRESNGTKYVFLLNYEGTPVTVRIGQEVWDCLAGRKTVGNVELKGYDCMVLRL